MSKSVELVYSRLVADEKLKIGTAYERLAALVFYLLSGETTVHDLRLRGISGVLHQIDVTVGDKAERKRVLIECKDYDKPVGLGLVRSFFGVVEDLRPDEAFVVTTDRFTAPARRYAEAKGIALAVLRPPRDEDWNGLVKQINLRLEATAPVGVASVELQVGAEDLSAPLPVNVPKGRVEVGAIEMLDAAGARRPFENDLMRALGSVPLGFEGEWRAECHFDEPTWVTLGEQAPVRLLGFVTRQQWAVLVDEMAIGHGLNGLMAELVLRSLDGSIHRMFTNRELQDWTFNADGRVIPADEA